MNCASTYPDAHVIPTAEITATLERWQIIHNCFIGVRGHHTIAIDEKIEGEMLERAIWASLESVFPLTLHKSPQVRIGTKMRELTDVVHYLLETWRSYQSVHLSGPCWLVMPSWVKSASCWS